MKNFFTILNLLAVCFTTFAQQQQTTEAPSKRPYEALKNEVLNVDKYRIDSIHTKTKDNYTAPQIFSERAINDFDKKTGLRNVQTHFISTDGKNFTNYYRFLFTYYPNGFLHTLTKEWWTPSSNSWVGRYRTTDGDFDVNGNSETNEFEKWNTTTNVYDKDMLNKSKYNAVGNNTLNKDYTWDIATKKYLLSGLDSLYSFDANGNTLGYTSFEVSNTGIVTPTEKLSQKFNTKNQLIEDITETWNGSAWENKALHVYKYDATINNKVFTNSLWNKTAKIWEIYDKDSIVFNANKYIVKYEHKRWNKASNSFVNFSVTNATYDPAKDYIKSTDTYETWDTIKKDYSLTYLFTFFSSELLSANSDVYLSKAFNFSPNPVSDVINLSFSFEKNSDIQINIINNTGQLITHQNFKNIQESQTTLSVANLPNGIYFMQLISEGKQATKRMVVSR
jgi:Secretion system C-terminal sorting domain